MTACKGNMSDHCYIIYTTLFIARNVCKYVFVVGLVERANAVKSRLRHRLIKQLRIKLDVPSNIYSCLDVGRNYSDVDIL